MLPVIVEDISSGNLAMLNIIKNFGKLIGKSAPIYVINPFGVPGIKYAIKSAISSFLESLQNLLFSILLIFSFETIAYMNFFPNF